MTKTSPEGKRSMRGKVLTRHLWVPVMTALLVVTPLPWPVTPVMAATITVNTTSDDFTGNNGQCSLREAIAVANANSNAAFPECAVSGMLGNDTIVLQSGATYTLSLEDAMTPGDEDTAAEDDLDIADASTAGTLTIQGNGATIERSTAVTCNLNFTDAAGEFRIFDVLTGTPGGNLTLQNVTVKNGCADGSFPDNAGGGIFNGIGGTVTLTNSTISNNSAGRGSGGGIGNDGTVTITNSTISGNNSAFFAGGIGNDGTMTITNSTISGNTAVVGGGIFNGIGRTVTITDSTISNNSVSVGGGGGIGNFGTVTLTNSTISGNTASDLNGGGIGNDSTGTVTLTNSTISENSAKFFGGGISNAVGGTVTLTTSTISNNSAGRGGGIGTGGTVTLTTSTISDNSAGDDGGGIVNGGTVMITTSTISSNSARTNGGGISNIGTGTMTITGSTISDNSAGDDGGGIINDGTVTITNSTISDNSANSGSGGGIGNDRGTVSVTGSTLSGNQAADIGGALWNNQDSTASVSNSTLSGNFAGNRGGGIRNDGTVKLSFVTIANNSTNGLGGGLFSGSTGTASIKNSIVGDNTAGGGGPNCSGGVTTSGTNLATDAVTTSCGMTNFTYVSSTGAGGLNLGPLQVNAPGTTATHALQSGSAAIDAVTDCTDLKSPTPQQVTTDQRGVGRPQGSLCDAGAYEAEQFTLTVNKTGSGSGTVTSNPAGITCGMDCTEDYREGSVVMLTATADSGSVFAGRSGNPDCSDGSVTMNGDKTCTATFNLPSGTIVIIKDAVPNDTQDFSFSGSGPSGFNFGGGFSLDDDSNATLPNQRTFANLTPGTYTVTEAATAGWSLTNLVCTDPDNGTTVNLSARQATIDLDAGETVRCTFTNTKSTGGGGGGGSGSLLTLQSNGHCLELDRNQGTYRFRSADGRIFIGQVRFLQQGTILRFQSLREHSPLLKGAINLSQRSGNAGVVVPLSQGGGRFVITDPNIDDNTCRP